MPHTDVQNTIKKQSPHTKSEFDERAMLIIGQMAEQVRSKVIGQMAEQVRSEGQRSNG